MSDPTVSYPSISSTISLDSQVGGHAGITTSEDGSLLIKSALPLEVAFYQSLTSDSAFEALRPFIPKFYGTLKLEGQVAEDQMSVEPLAGQSQNDESPLYSCCEQGSMYLSYIFSGQLQSLVLENLSHKFYKPNILDVKLGTVLHDESASPEKVERMNDTARSTTSLDTGVRLTGFQVYDNTTGAAMTTPKSYGKSITASQLPEGIAKFFPSTASEGLPSSVLLPILREIRLDVKDIREAFAQLELRMVGGSMLIIYEGDLEKAKEGIRKMEEGEADGEIDGQDGDGDDDEDEDGSGPPFVVKLIDFAHTKTVAGKGPDVGVLLGMDTVLKLLDGRIKEIERGN